tara:strand:+ start:559 stop:1569 length:1011 start_codon:yes stop_codon:yes gene_type:complete
MINIKISLPGQKSRLNISQFIENNENQIENFKFHINTNIDSPNYWFIIEDLDRSQETCFISKDNIYFLTNETLWHDTYWQRESKKNFLDQFSKIFTNYELIHRSKLTLPFLPWMINANHGDSVFHNHERDKTFFKNLKSLDKIEKISIITSNKIISDEHVLRYEFAKKLKSYFGEDIEWFGVGINEIEEKWEGIHPFKYHIALENKRQNYVISEKLYDSFLGLSYPFYSGAPNVYDYFPKNSLTTIDITDFKSSVDTIKDCLNKNTYDKNFQSILIAKNIVLNELNLFNRIVNIIKDEITTTSKKQKITLKDTKSYIKNYERRYKLKKNLYNLIKK